MSAPMKVTATVAVWLSKGADPTRLLENIESGHVREAIEQLAFYGASDRETFGDWIRVGDADVTITLMPRDEQVRRAVAMLKEQLDNARAEWLTKQQQILDKINSLQAIEHTAEAG